MIKRHTYPKLLHFLSLDDETKSFYYFYLLFLSYDESSILKHQENWISHVDDLSMGDFCI